MSFGLLDEGLFEGRERSGGLHPGALFIEVFFSKAKKSMSAAAVWAIVRSSGLSCGRVIAVDGLLAFVRHRTDRDCG